MGWDKVGDLRDFESKESFRTRFDKEYGENYNNHTPTISKKANEVWTLSELEPGDLVVANKGTSQILAIGKVVEPAYTWKPDREEFRHTVQVEWDTSYAKTIPPQNRWALVTVAPVSAALYDTIVGEKAAQVPPPPIDPLLRDIAEALERKGQVILYGPPGTGKTYHARRFAVAWLLQHEGRTADAQTVLADVDKFLDAERELSTVQVSRRVWWVVANPKEWSWDRLFKEKRVSYERRARHRRDELFRVLDRHEPAIRDVVFRLVDSLVAKADVLVHYQRADRSIILNASTGQPYARVVPDILVERRGPDATTRLAIDAKYKLYDERRLSSGDVYQSFLYAYAYGNAIGHSLPSAFVVYPSAGGGGQSVRLRIRSAQTLAAAEILALGLSIPDILAEVTAQTQGPVTKALTQAIQQGLGDTKWATA